MKRFFQVVARRARASSTDYKGQEFRPYEGLNVSGYLLWLAKRPSKAWKSKG